MSFGRMLKSAWNMVDKGFQAGDKAMDASLKVATAIDNVADVAVTKSEHFKSRARLETKTDYIMDLVEIYRTDPVLGELYISDPDNLPTGVTAEDIREALKPSKPELLPSGNKGKKSNTDDSDIDI